MDDQQNKSPSRSSARRSTKATTRRWPFGKIVYFFFTASLIGAAALVLTLLYLRSQALPVIKVMQTTQIYDINGQIIDSFYYGQNREVVSLHEISPYLIQATLAIEDHRFYDHYGLDPKGMARAAWVNLRNMSLYQGASTITQQLARNLYLTHERSWERKIKEAIYAVQLELQLSKDQILERYLNQIYYGFSTYGVEAAAKLYFGKKASELTLAESAMLAGIPKGPKYYSPYLDIDNATTRQKNIIEAMYQHGFITKDEREQALKEELQYQPRQTEKAKEASYFRDYVRTIAVDTLGIEEELFDSGGLKVYTTLDLDAQRVAEKIITEKLQDVPEIQAALISIDPRNGYIKAMVGGRDYHANQFNRAVHSKRQPGSAFKPFVYLTALQSGFTPVTRIESQPTTFLYDDGRQTYTPSNFGNRYFGSIDLREAIARSDNVYAVTTLMEVGAEQVMETASHMGISSQMKPLPSLALGTFPVSPMEMASAFGIFANQGVRIEPIAILRIEDARGKILYQVQSTSEQVIDPAFTYVMTHLMESVFDTGGTGSRVASALKRPVAGKTGTTDTDSWIIGYTPELSTAVWIGYDRGRNVTLAESYLAAPIFAEYTEKVLEAVPPKLFAIPDGVVSVYIDPSTGRLSTSDCPESRLESFVMGTEPLEYCTEHGHTEEPGSIGSPPPPQKNSTWWQDLKRWWTE